MLPTWQTFGDTACHPFAALKGKLREGEGSGSPDAEILRCAQDDSQDTTQVMSPLSEPKPFAALRASAHSRVNSAKGKGRSREVLSPNVCLRGAFLAITFASMLKWCNLQISIRSEQSSGRK